ncbi:MAG: N-6 DNA methylase, partial [Planctomycetia bacterium]
QQKIPAVPDGTLHRVLAALEMLLSRQCLLAAPTPARLPTLLAKSRDFQATVSTALAQQVIDAAFELVRGFQAANEKTHGELLANVLATKPNEVYEGLLTVLMRLVFTLYAEDRGLLPSSSLYQQHYGIHGLFERLRGDAAKHPDTMDLRLGAWAQLVALFRLIYAGSTHPELKLPARSGYLFDPDRFPWLEGRTSASGPQQKIPAVPDGTLHRVLEKLLMLDGERLSYRTLDVEQIGSVYEVMMGFGIGLADGPSIAIKPKKKHGAPVPVNLDALLACKPADRTKWVETTTDHKLTAKQAEPLKTATSIDALLAALEAAKKIARSATPQPLAKGAMLLVPSDERRRSGSNYTPRKLTEPIVRKTLEPILANLGEKPTPAQLLDLKICDPAMGSGAFLVEACRQLADHLVVAWQRHG